MQRTVCIVLEPSRAQATALTDTAAQFTAVFNKVAAYGWGRREKNGVTLHHACYRPLKAQYPDLVSDLHIQARVKATEAVKSTLARLRRGRKVSCPQSSACPPRYNVHTFTVDWESRTVRLSTTAGRQTLRFHVPAYFERYMGAADVDTADLIHRDGRWRLHIVVTVPTPEVAANDTVIGVDFGLNQPVVTSHNRFLGRRRWRAIEARRFKLKRALQRKANKSAKRHLRRVRHKQARFRRDCDHVLSKQIVAATPPGGTIALENLKEVRTRAKRRRGKQNRRLHSWSFAQIKTFVTYKAESRGCTVAAVDPRHTSQRCSRCGYTARNNRRSRAWFRCRRCGFQLHADLNGARNIAAKYHASRSNAAWGGLSVNQPIVGRREFAHA
jgi:IS605 OrfB family transposase